MPTVKNVAEKRRSPNHPCDKSAGSHTFCISENPQVGVYEHAAVAIDGEPCATNGKEILLEGETAVDATIGAMFCNGEYSCHSMGIGGGFLSYIRVGHIGIGICIGYSGYRL